MVIHGEDQDSAWIASSHKFSGGFSAALVTEDVAPVPGIECQTGRVCWSGSGLLDLI